MSVNTVYNYFDAKEDLVLPPDEASSQRLAEIVRRRRPGESAAGEPPDAIADAVLTLLDVVESLLGDRVLRYAVREETPCGE
ncbi:hypothetical protein OUY22_00905 [Nonomuraea sp. MCN248]|uniref:TetR family transcriptional regulator n=1 Tax=Nonomuraea corallina TaxID=2989783 RepID=A0ABT4S434_9ACTN|nr:hypothetical protein [Nonomuraea corallina]MDA0631959.1 hypothetical protein [Nonomuraea corallina]